MANGYWGKILRVNLSTREISVDEHNEKAACAMIGPGGERFVRFACIALDMHDYIGRCGLGAVMGAKKLKALALNGNTRPQVADKETIADLPIR